MIGTVTKDGLSATIDWDPINSPASLPEDYQLNTISDASLEYEFGYDANDLLTSITLNVGGNPYRRIRIERCGPSDARGPEGSIRDVYHEDWDDTINPPTGGWRVMAEEHRWNYSTGGADDGLPEYKMDRWGVERARADGVDPSSCAKTVFDDYAGKYYGYDGSGRVSVVKRGECGTCGGGGFGEMRYGYGTSSEDPDTGPIDKWTHYREDDSRPVVGGSPLAGKVVRNHFNSRGQILYTETKHYASGGGSPVKTERAFSAYTQDGRLASRTSSEAISAMTVNGDGTFSATIEANAGLIQADTFYDGTSLTADGLSAVYRNNASPNEQYVRIDSTVNTDWNAASPVSGVIDADGFKAVWTGSVDPQYTEAYTFYVEAENGTVKLYVNNLEVINQAVTSWTKITAPATVSMTAGAKRAIRLEYTHTTGDASAVLKWSSPTQAEQVIPQARLYSGVGDTGFLRRTQIKKGSSGTLIPIADYEYLSGVTPKQILSKVTRYPNDNNTNDGEETLYEYPEGFYDGLLFQPVQRVTKVKLATGVHLTTRERYNEEGQVEWRKDASGSVTFYEYHTSGEGNGQVKHEVRDINTASGPSGVTLPGTIPTDFATGSGLNLVTAYTYSDEDGSVKTVKDPSGGQTHYLSLDHEDKWVAGKEYARVTERRVYPLYWNGSAYELTGPVQISFAIEEGGVLSSRTAKVTLASAATGPAAGDTIDKLLSRTDSVYNGAGQLTETRVWFKYDGSGVLVADADTDDTPATGDYLATAYEYDAEGRVKQTTDPLSKKVFHTRRVHDLSGSGSGPFYYESRTYPHKKAAGPIQVTWTDTHGHAARSFLASTADTDWNGSMPTGTETLTELTRSVNIYDDADWRGRLEKTRVYHSLSGLSMSQNGSAGTNYYETSYLAYDNQDRLLRVRDGMGDISATVYDAAGRALSQWRGTDASGATRTDPSGGGGNDMKKVAETFYDADFDGYADDDARPHVTRSVRLKPLSTLAGSSADYTGVTYGYDSAGRQTITTSDDPDGGGSLLPTKVVQTLDAAGRATSVKTYSVASGGGSDTLIAQTDSVYNNGGQLTTSKLYSVASGTAGDYLQTAYTYDDAGRSFKVARPEGGFAISEYDAAGRVTHSYVVSSDNATATLDDDIVLAETVYEYDAAGNVILVTSYARRHDDTSTDGRLSDNAAAARVTYVATWYDDAHRPTHVADYGKD